MLVDLPLQEIDKWVLQSLRTIPEVDYRKKYCEAVHSLNQDHLFDAALGHRLAHIVGHALEGNSPAPLFDRYTAAARALTEVQLKAMEEVILALDAVGVSCLLIKGSTLNKLLIPSAPPSVSADIDILVNTDALNLVREAMLELGYSQHIEGGVISQEQIKHFEDVGYQLAPFSRYMAVEVRPSTLEFLKTRRIGAFIRVEGEEVRASVAFDFHRTLHQGVSLEDSLIGAQVVRSGDLTFSVPSNETLVWFWATRLYYDTKYFRKRKLKGLGDLAWLLHDRSVDFEKLATMVQKYSGFFGSTFHVLSALVNLGATRLTSDQLSEIYPMTVGVSGFPPADFGDYLSSALRIPISGTIKSA